jgi:hypothetical protein
MKVLPSELTAIAEELKIAKQSASELVVTDIDKHISIALDMIAALKYRSNQRRKEKWYNGQSGI